MSFGGNEFDYKGGLKVRVKTIISWKPEALIKAVNSAGEKALAKLASFVWTKAHQSIRNKKASPPGTAMGRGTGFMRESLVVQQINKRELHIGFYRGGWVADLHEWGATKGMRRPKPTKGILKYRSDERFFAKYPPRPTMRLALEKAESDFSRKFPEDFARYFGSVSRGYGD